MKRRIGHSPAGRRMGAVWAAAVLLGVGAEARAQGYTVTPIALRAVTSHHYSINNSGQVAGWVNVSGTTRAFRWTPTIPNGTSGVLVNLGPPSGSDYTAGRGMSSLGDVVGNGGMNSAGYKGLLWPAGGGVVDLGNGGGITSRNTWAVNASGDIAISQYNSKSASSTGTPILRFVNGKQKLYRLANDVNKVMDSNDSGQALSYSGSIIWSPTSATTWSMQALVGSGGTGHDLNENGEVAGQFPEGGRARPFVYLPTPRYGLGAGINNLWPTVLAGIGPPAAGVWHSGIAFGVNDVGVVVGRANARDANASTDTRAWIWDQNLGLRGLSALVAPTGWTLTDGWSRINNAGQIVTTATDGTGEYCVLLTPSP